MARFVSDRAKCDHYLGLREISIFLSQDIPLPGGTGGSTGKTGL